jgi:hypothetical protein
MYKDKLMTGSAFSIKLDAQYMLRQVPEKTPLSGGLEIPCMKESRNFKGEIWDLIFCPLFMIMRPLYS